MAEADGIVFDDTQIEAINRCCDISSTNRIVPVTGQAGTGKTSILQEVYNLLTAAGYRVALCAPTGKAAKRIMEITGIPAVTNHRLLEYPHPGERDPETGKPLNTTDPKRDRRNPLEYDVVLADEYAMVNLEVHRNLMDALPRGCFRLFGDVNQLPPIERDQRRRNKPSPFKRALELFDGVILTTIHRQSDGSGIVTNGALILRGRIPKRNDDWSMQITDRPIDALRAHIREDACDYSLPTNQIITPTRKTWIGTAKLNAMLQAHYRPESDGWIAVPRHPWAVDKDTFIREGDKVIWTENDYNLNIFNGETGLVCDVMEAEEEFSIDLGDRIVSIPPIVFYEHQYGERHYDPRKSVELAYAITTHKAQGSEYDNVVYMINKSASFMQNRNNFYTGTMRASKHVHLITDQKSLNLSTWKTYQGAR